MKTDVLPVSVDAERGAVGCMLIEPERVVPLARDRMLLGPDAFADLASRAVCEAIYDMAAAGRWGIDVLTVGEKLRLKGDLEKIGGMMALDEFVGAPAAASHAEYYLDIVRQKYIARRIIGVSDRLIRDARVVERGDTLLRAVPDIFGEIIGEMVREEKNSDVLDRLVGRWEEARAAQNEGREVETSGLKTPWPKLNRVLGGLEPGLIVMAGRPSQGKTTVEDCISVDLASQGVGVGRVTLDMNRERLLARAVCRKAGVSMPKLKNGYARQDQIAAVKEAAELIAGYPMWINDTDRELRAICSWARMMKMQNNIGLLTIDYVQQIQVSDGKRGWNENAEITHVSQAIKGLVGELGIPVLLLSQLNRDADRGDRIPKLSDLRGSGSLEQDASVVIFSYKDKEGEEINGRTPQWLDIAKHQDGETGALEFWFRRNYFRFDEAPENFEEGVDNEEF